MKLKCKLCGKVINRDMRFNINKMQMTKRGFKSICDKTKQLTYLTPTP